MNESKKIRILIFVRYVGCQGGIQQVVRNYYSRFDKTQFELEYLVLTHENPVYEEQLVSEGIKIHSLDGVSQKNLLRLISSCKEFFSVHRDYDILHCHQTNFDFIPLFFSRWYGIPVRIMHAHSANFSIGALQILCEKYLSRSMATQYVAISDAVGRFFFGRKAMQQNQVHIIVNAIDLSKYTFDPTVRINQRAELGIRENEFAFCHIGRFSPEKRQELIIRAFAILHAKEKNTKLFFVGSGENNRSLQELAASLIKDGSLVFLGFRSDISLLLKAFDVFVLASMYEGVSIALLEAQAAGLPCLLSDGLYSVLSDKNQIMRIPQNAVPEVWAKGMQRCLQLQRYDGKDALQKAGYSIKEQAQVLQNFYKELQNN